VRRRASALKAILVPNCRLVPLRNKTFAQRAAEYSSLALVLPVSTFAGYLIGHWLDGLFGTTWLRIALLMLGSVGGFIQLIRQIMRDSRDDDA
jgi:F0F1-type ATP synthase assembly protein I